MSDESVFVNVEIGTDSSEGKSDSSLCEDVERHDQQLEQITENQEALKDLLDKLVDLTDDIADTVGGSDPVDTGELDDYGERTYQ